MPEIGRRAATTLVLAAFVSAAGAAPPAGLSVELVPGLDGYYRVGSVLPVTVTIENRGRAWRGQIEIGPVPASYLQPIALAAPARKRYAFALPSAPAMSSLELRLVADRGAGATPDVRVTAPLRPLSPATPLYLAVAEAAPAGALGTGEGGRLVWMHPGDLPEDWRGYDPAAAVLMAAESAALLRPAQRRALADWLTLGGRLVLGAGAPVEPSRLFGAAAPAALETAAGELRWGRGSLRRVDTPLPPRTVAEARASSADRVARPFAPADRALLGRLPPDPAVLPRPAASLIVFFLAYGLAQALVLVLAARAPRGPLPGLAASLALAAVATLVLGGLGRLVHRGRVPFAGTSVVHVFAGVEHAFVTARGDLLATGGEALRLDSRLRHANLEAEAATGTVRYGVDARGRAVVEVAAATWRILRVWAQGFANLGLRLEAETTGPVRLRNGSRWTLDACHRLARGRAERLGDLVPGASLELPAAGAPGRTRGLAAETPADDAGALGARARSAYRLAGSADGDGVVLCSVAGEVAALAADRPLDVRAAEAVVVFHLP